MLLLASSSVELEGMNLRVSYNAQNTHCDALLNNDSVNTFQPTCDQQWKDIRCWVTDG
jgi:hypothetical protein